MYVLIRDALFGCPHSSYGFPITRNSICYRVCLECGHERKYDFVRMRFVNFERGEERRLQSQPYTQVTP